jgi:hypothetical protein
MGRKIANMVTSGASALAPLRGYAGWIWALACMRQLGVFRSYHGADGRIAILMLGGIVLVILVCMTLVMSFARLLLFNMNKDYVHRWRDRDPLPISEKKGWKEVFILFPNI